MKRELHSLSEEFFNGFMLKDTWHKELNGHARSVKAWHNCMKRGMANWHVMSIRLLSQQMQDEE